MGVGTVDFSISPNAQILMILCEILGFKTNCTLLELCSFEGRICQGRRKVHFLELFRNVGKLLLRFKFSLFGLKKGLKVNIRLNYCSEIFLDYLYGNGCSIFRIHFDTLNILSPTRVVLCTWLICVH